MKPKELNRATGKTGEQIAEDHLKKLGYRILKRNVCSPFGEIDLVADHKGTLVFIEVKSRRSTAFGVPEEAVDKRKKTRLARLATWYLAQHSGSNPAVRFDVLAIEFVDPDPRIRLIQNAFEL